MFFEYGGSCSRQANGLAVVDDEDGDVVFDRSEKRGRLAPIFKEAGVRYLPVHHATAYQQCQRKRILFLSFASVQIESRDQLIRFVFLGVHHAGWCVG